MQSTAKDEAAARRPRGHEEAAEDEESDEDVRRARQDGFTEGGERAPDDAGVETPVNFSRLSQ